MKLEENTIPENLYIRKSHIEAFINTIPTKSAGTMEFGIFRHL